MKKIKPIVITLVLLTSLFSFGYWLKCQKGMDLVKSFHLSAFSLLQPLQNNPNITHHIVLAAEVEYLLNDSFKSEVSKDNWSKLWMREENKVRQGYDLKGMDKSRCLLIKSSSKKDWSYWHNKLVQVEERDIFNFEGFVKTSGEKIRATLGVVLYDKDKKVVQWNYAREDVGRTEGWVKLVRRFMVPKEIEYIKFGLTGAGVGKSWFDNIKFQKEEKSIVSGKNLKSHYFLENALLRYSLNVQEGIISALDKRINKEWMASRVLDRFFILKANKTNTSQMDLKIIDRESLQQYKIAVILNRDLAEIDYEIEQLGSEKFEQLEFPPVFTLEDNMQLVVPLQEGMLIPGDFPVEDFPWRLRYFGWQLSMPFIGVVDGESGWIEIVETPNDFEIVKDKDKDGKLLIKNRWISQMGVFGYNRHIKYCFFDKGGYAAMAKRYRQYAKDKGLFKSLKEKNAARKGNISKLVGAVNVWYWGLDERNLAKDMVEAGIKKALFSNTDKWSIKKIDSYGFLTSKYDIYQDVWPPIYHDVTHRHDGWPEDLVLDKDGNWIRGWTIKKGLKEYPGGVICSIRGLKRAQKEIPKDLKDKPYTARFIDTTTCSPWRECYHPEHPTTRSEDVKYKMELLKFCSEDMHLVSGSENGVDCAVPYCDYFEGMMSIGIGRLPGSGRNVAKVKYERPTGKFFKYQVGEKYRVPLWELVYGDCVVSTWYWGDSSNRIPEVWYKRDLFNILYGNMPLWAIRDWEHWKKYRSRFIESYNNVCPVFEKVGFEEMLSHKFVSDDRTVQETRFSGDIRVVVNFGDKEYVLKNPEYILPTKGFVVFEKGSVCKMGICSIPES